MGTDTQTHRLLRDLSGDGLALDRDDPLAAVISDLEARLELIRETHLEQEMLEVDVISREGELIIYRDDIARRERSLSEDATQLADEERQIAEQRSAFSAERKRLDERLGELERLEMQLLERQRDQALADEDLSRERATIESRRQEIEQERARLREREEEVEARFAQIRGERERLEAAQAQLEADKRRLEEQAREQEALSEQLEKMRADLAQREAELESRFSEHDELKGMLSALTKQLEDSREQARRHAEEYQRALAEKAEEAARSEDLERRCRHLETERARIRGELTKVREELDAHALFSQQQQARQSLRTRLSPSRAARIGAGIFFGTMAIGALGMAVGAGQGTAQGGVVALGVALAACLVGTHALVGRAFDSSMLLIAVLVGTLGVWFGPWTEAASTAASLWAIPESVIPASMLDRVPMAFSALSASFAVSVCLYLLTGSGTVLGHALFATLVAGGMLMAPEQSLRTQGIAGMLWLAILAATLTKWSVLVRREQDGALV